MSGEAINMTERRIWYLQYGRDCVQTLDFGDFVDQIIQTHAHVLIHHLQKST